LKSCREIIANSLPFAAPKKEIETFVFKISIRTANRFPAVSQLFLKTALAFSTSY